MSLLGEIASGMMRQMSSSMDRVADKTEKRAREYEREAERRNYQFSDEQRAKLDSAREKAAQARAYSSELKNEAKEAKRYFDGD